LTPKSYKFPHLTCQPSHFILGNTNKSFSTILLIYIYHIQLVDCCNNDSIWHRLWDVTTFTVYVTNWLWPWEILCSYHDTMLTRYILSCVCLSVHHKRALYQNG